MSDDVQGQLLDAVLDVQKQVGTMGASLSSMHARLDMFADRADVQDVQIAELKSENAELRKEQAATRDALRGIRTFSRAAMVLVPASIVGTCGVAVWLLSRVPAEAWRIIAKQ